METQKLLMFPVWLSSFFFFFFFNSFSTEPLQYQYQAFFPTSLPEVTQDLETLSWDMPQQFSDSESKMTSSSTVVLYHIDHLSSDSNSTPESLFLNRLQRDAIRVAAIATRTGNFSSPIISGFSHGIGEYFTLIGVGTPPKPFYMILDTGSDLTWLECLPCETCYHHQLDGIFVPTQSSSFALVHCYDLLCYLLQYPLGSPQECNKQPDQHCLYEVQYGDGSFTKGELSTETLTFGKTKVSKVPLGCGYQNKARIGSAAGLLGLGHGKLSLPNQVGINSFSYCLTDTSNSSSHSYLTFGNSVVSNNTIFTPLLRNPTYYYVELLGISVGGKRVSGITPSLFNEGMIVDSGTTLTWLPQLAYEALRDAFLDAGASNLMRAPSVSILDTCFYVPENTTKVKVPTVELHFKDADVSLPASNYMYPVDNNGTFCFAFANRTDGPFIIGNIQQQGFRVVYDLANNQIGFAPNSC
ncbi:Eukaryotic aspartyl protease family protein [Striga hermonthica]|uniref:Eukaryotic aspartyl protease family protein n=1 Tax=Striga hermonthica TaxID=68872 RepID=A0A9N7RIY0_STRHE|nr:Eukaryotic aspartyl protease family protein [Striga hermonthica]